MHGIYEKSLTVASSNDVIIDGSTLSLERLGQTRLLGLARDEALGHDGARPDRATTTSASTTPASSGTNETGSLNDPWIYAGILATQHSFVVDNSGCGAGLGKLNVYGAIGQNYRGVVGRSGGGRLHQELRIRRPPGDRPSRRTSWRR